MSRTILITAILSAIASILLTAAGVSSQDREEKEQTQPELFSDEDPFARDPSADKIPDSDRLKLLTDDRSRIDVDRRGAICGVLEESTKLEFTDAPLHDVVKHLGKLHRLPIYIDRRALSDVSLTTDEPITINLEGVPLRSALKLMLSDLDLALTTIEGVLVITTLERAECRLSPRVYDVSDLVFPTRDMPYDGRGLPTTPQRTTQTISTGRSMGQGTGGIGEGMGISDVADSPRVSTAVLADQQGPVGAGCFDVDGTANRGSGAGALLRATLNDAADEADMDAITRAITSSIDPVSWEEFGGPGSIHHIGRFLVISQTFEIHQQIKEFLNDLREAVPTVVVDARWVLLEAGTLDAMLGGKRDPECKHARFAVDPVALERITDAASGARGRITCASGQKVHLTAGERRVVGLGATANVAVPNVGIVLEIRPTVLPDRQSVVLNVRNIVTQWNEPRSVTEDGIDRVRMPTQQFAATMRVPLGKPVLIGGMTLSPTDAGPKEELYLVIETSIVEQR